MRSRRDFLAAAGATLPLIIAAPSLADPVLAAVGNANVPPKAWLDGNGVPRGYAIDAGLAVLEQAGFRAEVQLYPWRRAYETARSGRALLLGVFRVPGREQDFRFSAPYAQDEVVLAVRRGSGFTFQRPEELAGLRVGFQDGAVYGPLWPEVLRWIDAVPDSNPETRLRKLHAGRIDAAVFNPGLGALRMNALRTGLDMRDFYVLDRRLAYLPVHIGVPMAMADEPMLTRINLAIATLEEHGQLSRIIRSYRVDRIADL